MFSSLHFLTSLSRADTRVLAINLQSICCHGGTVEVVLSVPFSTFCGRGATSHSLMATHGVTRLPCCRCHCVVIIQRQLFYAPTRCEDSDNLRNAGKCTRAEGSYRALPLKINGKTRRTVANLARGNTKTTHTHSLAHTHNRHPFKGGTHEGNEEKRRRWRQATQREN